MRGHPSDRPARLRVLALLLAGMGAACSPDRLPEPEQPPHYEAVDSQFCERMRMDDIAAAFGLALPSHHEATESYTAPGGRQAWTTCRFSPEVEHDEHGVQ